MGLQDLVYRDTEITVYTRCVRKVSGLCLLFKQEIENL